MHLIHAHGRGIALIAAIVVIALTSTGCSTAPKAEDRATFMADAQTATRWFERNVEGLEDQIDDSAAYVIFPAVGQWGIIIGGGQFGRGSLNRPDGSQIGWAAINTGSIGLQAGVRGFKMLVVLRNEQTLDQFMDNRLSGSVDGVAVAGEAGTSGRASFDNGVAIYQGASTGLIAGVNIGLDYLRYEPLDNN